MFGFNKKEQNKNLIYDEAFSNIPPVQNNFSLKRKIIVLLENGVSFEGNLTSSNNPKVARCKMLFKCHNNQHDLTVNADIDIQTITPTKINSFQSTLNNFFLDLFDEAKLDFPEWLIKYSSKSKDIDPIFHLGDIRKEFKIKKIHFGIWLKTVSLGIFDVTKPQYSKFNKVIRVEISELL